MRQSVTLLYRGVRLGAELLALLDEERDVNVLGSPLELAKSSPPPDVVVVDVPARDRGAVCKQVRRHYRGPLIVLLNRGDNSQDLPPDRSRTLLTRPFSIHELSVALATATPTQSTSDPLSQLRLLMGQKIQDRDERPSLGTGASTVRPAIPLPARRWRERRAVRVSAISVTVALLFMAAFALVNRGIRCGAGCDELTGADFTFPSSSTVGPVGGGPYTTDPRLGVVGPTTTEPSVGPAADDGSPSDGSTNSGAPISTTTAWSSGATTPTSSEDPSRPQPNTPSTVASTTTKPRAPTTTATTATTTTTTTAPTATTEP